jgi:FkbM family methyltransferase
VKSKVRRLAWEAWRRLPERTLTARTRHGRLTFSSRDAAVGRRLYSHGEFEYDKIEKALGLVRAAAPARAGAGWLLDVGANIGTVCIPLVRDRAFARALAFEPEPRNYRFLVENVRANGLESAITAVNAGVSSANTTMTMELAFDNFGDHRIRVGTPRSSHPECREEERAVIQVPVHRLDDYLASVPVAPSDVGLLWIDVQGHEHHVLEGASAVLAAGVPVVAEFWPYALARAGTDATAFVGLLRSRFRWFYDLEEAAPARCPVADADVLLSRYRADTAFTDVLLLPG